MFTAGWIDGTVARAAARRGPFCPKFECSPCVSSLGSPAFSRSPKTCTLGELGTLNSSSVSFKMCFFFNGINVWLYPPRGNTLDHDSEAPIDTHSSEYRRKKERTWMDGWMDVNHKACSKNRYLLFCQNQELVLMLLQQKKNAELKKTRWLPRSHLVTGTVCAFVAVKTFPLYSAPAFGL